MIDKAPWINAEAGSYSEYNHGVKNKTAFCGGLQADNAPFNASLTRSACADLGQKNYYLKLFHGKISKESSNLSNYFLILLLFLENAAYLENFVV